MNMDKVEIGPCVLYHGDAVECLRAIHDSTIDAIVCDPPYAEIDRDYGRMSEPAWHALMNEVVSESRRVLTPRGSAVYVLQPNSERVGRMRSWLWEFMAKWAREWNMVQDVWWWNPSAPPTIHVNRDIGLMRPSVKACVWLGESNCYRKQDIILWKPSDATMAVSRSDRALHMLPSGLPMRRGRCVAASDERGGVTPFNLLPIPNANSINSAGAHGHGAGTPMPLVEWWIRYISPKDGVVCDPFVGSGTTGIACVKLGRRFIGIEKDPEYFAIAVERIRKAWQEEDAPFYREETKQTPQLFHE